MQIDQDMPSAMALRTYDANNEENNDEIMKTTISSDDKKSPKSALSNHADKIKRIHSARVQSYLKSEMQKMPSIDRQEVKDPQAVAEYSQKNFENMKNEELKFMVDHDYISKVQTEIRDTSRAFLLEWIIDVHRKFRLKPECLYVTQHIIDQFLSKKKIQKN